jgi:uncharacterized protein (TIGR02285 family)
MDSLIKILLVIILSVTLIFPGNSAAAEDTIEWIIVDYPPIYINDGPGKGEGIMNKITELAIKNLPEYQHKITVANITRTMVDFEQGKCVCTMGMIKTNERATVAHYSNIPSALLSKNRIIVRKTDLKALGNPVMVSLEEMIQNRSLKMGLASNISHGKEADAIINKYKSDANIFYRQGNNVLEGLLQMLLKKRIDYLITLPWLAEYTLKPDEIEKLSFLEIKESQENIIYYSLCAKTDWGQKVIRKIEAFLLKERPKTEYRSCMERWMPKEMLPEFRSVYENEFLTIGE